MLVRDMDRLPLAKLDEWVNIIETCYQFDPDEHSSDLAAVRRNRAGR
ncbi:hypothetical protein ACFPIJ_11730 [Dactylosporangium cerinum]|uniref:Uncharacterized protein n=1 Tax=Dactylosporangium cerinum TaxID=1434730 RepID=A0ABV9VTA1_9ACTN